MRRILEAISILAATCSLGCASIMHGKTQDVRVETDPPGVAFRVLPTGEAATTPAVVELPRNSPYTIVIRDPAYRDENVLLNPIFSNWLWGNLLFGGFIGSSIDTSSGAIFKLVPAEIDIVLEPVDEDGP